MCLVAFEIEGFRSENDFMGLAEADTNLEDLEVRKHLNFSSMMTSAMKKTQQPSHLVRL